MMKNMRWLLCPIFLFGLVGMIAYPADAQAKQTAENPVLEEQAYTLGTSAYLWGFPMTELYRVRDHFLKQKGNRLNRFSHFQTLLTAKTAREMGVVSANNATLYSNAWLDLSVEPIVLEFPEIRGRYFTFNYIDFYQVNGNISSVTVSRKGGAYAFTGPDWNGVLPPNMHRIRVKTNTVWILGRTEVKGANDLKNVIQLQKRYTLTSLSAYMAGKRNTTGKNKYEKWPDYDLSNPLNWYALLNEGLRRNPPYGDDRAMLGLFQTIHVGPQFDFQADNLNPAVAKGLTRAIETGNKIIAEEARKRIGVKVNSWIRMSLSDWPAELGGIGFLLRSAIALRAQPGQKDNEAMYYISYADDDNQPYKGGNRYTLTFQPGRMPPTSTFWTLMVYTLPGGWPVENPIHRYQLGTYDKLKKNRDGSITIYFQPESPGKDKESNWLPTPGNGEPFYLGGRVYTPAPAAVNGDWIYPTVKMAD